MVTNGNKAVVDFILIQLFLLYYHLLNHGVLMQTSIKFF